MAPQTKHREGGPQGAVEDGDPETKARETLKRKQDREQAKLNAFNDINKVKSAAQEMAEELFEAKHHQQSPAKMQRLAASGSTTEDQLAIPSVERLPYQSCPKCGYDPETLNPGTSNPFSMGFPTTPSLLPPLGSPLE